MSVAITAKVALKSRFPAEAKNMEALLEGLLDESSQRVETKWKSRVRVDTGEYRDSIEAVRTGRLRREVRSDVPHSIPNEYGTSKMAAQPDARRTAEEEPREIERSARRRKGR